jgi:hypothetical protein
MPARKHSYSNIKALFNEKGAVITITEDEFNNILMDQKISPSRYKFDVVAKCGHVRKIDFHRMQAMSTLLCLSCTKKKAIQKQIETHNSSIEYNLGYKLEYESYVYIKNLIGINFDVVKLPEGTKADLLIKPKYCFDDLWCQVQLKATKSPARRNQYNFNLRNNYQNMVVICHCLEGNKIWLVKGELFKNIKNVTFYDTTKSKYQNYKYDSNDLPQELVKLYEDKTITKINRSSAYTDVCPNVAKEQKYRLLRESKLSFLNFEYSEIYGLVYDFKINGYKIQEKYNNRTTDNPKRFNFHLNKYGGRLHNKTIESPYERGDNDFYWFHIPGDKLFYVIPETELLGHGYIKSELQSGKRSIVLHPHKSLDELTKKNISTTFANKYLFDYDNLDRAKLSSMFKK